MQKVPMIISLDIHYHDYENKLDQLPIWFEKALRVLDDLSIKATFFFPADCAELFHNEVRMIQDEGHEIGAHGLTHLRDDQYNRMPFEEQKSRLLEQKKQIEEVTRREILSFRGPAFKINGDTVRALDEVGFKVDSSVCPQRLALISSDVTNIGWLYSPRKPYHPSYDNPFVRGDASLWEIPVSSFVLPFMSNLGMAFGKTVEKLFFKFLHTESTMRGMPIVYLAHPEDISGNAWGRAEDENIKYKFHWHHLLPSKDYGFVIRYLVYHNTNPKKVSENIISLFKTIKSHKNIDFFTYGKMIALLENNSALN